MRRFKLALVLLILMINPVLYSQFVFGTGTEEDPYHITNPSELNSIRDFMTSYFTLDCDIDLALYLNEENEGYNNGEFWEPIGNSNNPFKGTIYGNAKRILNLKINRPDSIYIGLFGYADSCSVNDLSLEIDLESKIFGNELVGGLIGYCSNSSISKCSSVGTIEGETDTGGLIGYIKESTVTDCNAICTVTGWAGIGGLIGGNENGIINRCYSTGVIIETIGGYSIGGLVGLNDGYLFESFSNSDVEGESKIGGLVGINFGDSILNCYATGSVTGQTMGQDFGGLIGDNWGEVRNCYSTGVVTGGTNTGGFIGINSDGTVIDSYWDTETSGIAASDGGEGRTTSEMMIQGTYNGWDFTTPVWEMSSQNNGYPHLSCDYRFDFAGGTGSSEDPYLVSEMSHLDNVRNFLYANFKQMADLDLQWYESWSPIGYINSWNDARSFSGVYNGNGFTIENLMIYEPEKNNVGLFGYTCNASISNMNITNSSVTGGNSSSGTLGGFINATEITDCFAVNCSVSGVTGVGGLVGVFAGGSKMTNCSTTGSSVNGTEYYTGGLAGLVENYSEVINCSSNSQIDGGLNYSGGLVGFLSSFSSISDSYSLSEVNGISSTGGLAGYVTSSCVIENSYSSGNVNSTGSDTGGFAGNASDWPTIRNCYSRGNVIGTENVGGFIGLNDGSEITNCYSTGIVSGTDGAIGGFLGKHINGTVNSSYWDTETSGIESSAGGDGRTTEEMTYPFAPNTYTDWDFTTIWGTLYLSNGDYPYLEMEGPLGIDDNGQNIPKTTILYQNYPNPFNPVTEIKFSLNEGSFVRLSVFNSKGQLVKELLNENLLTGNHKSIFDASKLNSGLYFYRLNYGDNTLTKKMIFIK